MNLYVHPQTTKTLLYTIDSRLRASAVIEKILKMPIDELFITREVKPEIPVKAKIFKSVQCASCGEMVTEHRARVRNGTFVCMPCAGEYGRGW